MRQSQLFTKTRKEAPKDEVSKNAILLTRGGFVSKEMAGAYNFLPLGLRVLNKIVDVIREEMNAIGGQEIFMTSLQRKELWEGHFKDSRWDEEVWFKSNLLDGGETGMAFTHEEPISNMMEQFVSSYKDLPLSVYQFQTKFRNEERAKSGVMRTREFLMKDLYSFSKTQEEHEEFYEKAKAAYKKIFERVGLGQATYLTFASGGSFSKYSHEFQTVTPAGEDEIYVDTKKGLAVNKEVLNEEVLSDLGLNNEDLVKEKAVEVGNIFTLGTKFSDPHLTFNNEKGERVPVYMGSYGIGPARLIGTIVEVLSDEKGIVWPVEVAPFRAHLILASESARDTADATYEALIKGGVEVLYDDRDVRTGEKFADADLIGIPTRIVVGEKTSGGMLEVKDRATGKEREVTLENLIQELKE